MKFADMTSEQLAWYIKAKLTREPVVKADHKGPRRAIHGIDSTDLPAPLCELVNQILARESVFDVPSDEPNTTLAPHTRGKMRSYHGNIDLWLPPADPTKKTLKSQKYEDYIYTFKRQPNNLKGKSDGGTEPTGYVEYTAAGWVQDIQHGRLVYNYYEDLMYFGFHYQTSFFGENANPFVLVQWRYGPGKMDPGEMPADAGAVALVAG